MQKARSQPRLIRRPAQPPTACKYVVSETLSLPALGYFSPFPHGTRSLSVTRESLALEGGPPGFTPDSSELGRYSGYSLHCFELRLPECHRLWCPVPEDFGCPSQCVCESYNPAGPRTDGLGSARFARRYFGHLV
jgi:hypothetical protein